jgi:DNA polymerase III sliding clamp (beta) subunit (PCNA family)
MAELAIADRAGLFPPLAKIFERVPTSAIRVERSELLQAIQQVAFVLDETNNSLTITIDQERLIVKGQSSRGGEGCAELGYKPSERIPLPIKEFTAEYSPKLIIDFLKVMEDDMIEIGLRSPVEQVLITEPMTQVEYIVMPLRNDTSEKGGEATEGA